MRLTTVGQSETEYLCLFGVSTSPDSGVEYTIKVFKADL